jgi:hypothetical protein
VSCEPSIVPQQHQSTPFLEFEKFWQSGSCRVEITHAMREEFWKRLRNIARRILLNTLANLIFNFGRVDSWKLELLAFAFSGSVH